MTILSTVISDDQQYRYRLHRRLRDEGPGKTMAFVMLNPSTADHTKDDPTIRRCIGFAKREDCRDLLVINLFALRATDPAKLKYHNDPIGPENDAYIAEVASWIQATGVLVCAWGQGGRLRNRGNQVWRNLVQKGVDPYCLAKSAGGDPCHPLYLRKDLPLQKYVYRT